MSAPDPRSLLGVLVELERVRAAVLTQLERAVPALSPEPDGDPRLYSVHELLVGARRAVLGNPAAARDVFQVLAAEGRRYATTGDGADLRDRLATSEQVAHLRRIWETISLNVLDGPASPSGVPDAWADLLADAVTGHGLDALDDAVLARLRLDGMT
jgi:hypothetical protein